MVRKLLPKWTRLDLERPADYALLSADVEGFLDAHPGSVVFDEAQHLPALFPALRYALDRRKTKGRYVLLGSASPHLMRSVSETLAGRIGFVELAPFSAAELAGTSFAANRWLWGGYPPALAARSHQARIDWLDAYVTAFLERDIPALGLRLDPQRMRRLWTMLTHVHGNLLNVSDLARSLAVSSHTVDHYLDVLEGAFLIRRLPPHHANVQKRLTKSPKIYIRDTGLLHFLAGLRSKSSLETWPRRGASFEGLAVEEIAQRAQDVATRPHVAFWRTQAGAEVDLLVDTGRGLVPIEIKLGAAVGHADVAGLRSCMRDLGLKKGWVVAGCRERRRLGKDIEIVPWREVASGACDLGLGHQLP